MKDKGFRISRSEPPDGVDMIIWAHKWDDILEEANSDETLSHHLCPKCKIHYLHFIKLTLFRGYVCTSCLWALERIQVISLESYND